MALWENNKLLDMRLPDLIPYLKHNDGLKELYVDENLDSDSEAILVYMKDSLSLGAELKFFNVEETEDELRYENQGALYVQFFPLNYVVELVTSDFNVAGLSSERIAQRLLDYRIKDA